MKTKVSLILMLFLGLRLLANDLPKQDSNYVVIGAFASQANAIHFTEKAKKARLDAHFEINANRNLFYVYVLSTGDRELAFAQALDLRNKTTFSDTWVYTGFLGSHSAQENGTDIHPETGEKLPQVEVTPIAAETSSTTAPIVKEAETTKSGEGHTFLFKLTRASDQQLIDGEVAIFDSEKPNKLASYSGNQDVVITAVNKSGSVVVKCEPFGYRRSEVAINLNDPKATEFVSVEGGKVVVPFELVRLKKGDIVVMYNVFFFKDAAIMRPESKGDLNGLLQMMKENPKMKIRIHGHTNGNGAGKIIEPGDNKNFFSLSGTKEGFGSAKKLSEVRAQIISDFLASEGINPTRLEVKAWGGKKPIFEKDHARAHTNVRVEIEIVEE